MKMVFLKEMQLFHMPKNKVQILPQKISMINKFEVASKLKQKKPNFHKNKKTINVEKLKDKIQPKKIQAKMLEKKQLSWDEDIDEVGEGLKIVILKHVIDVSRANSD